MTEFCFSCRKSYVENIRTFCNCAANCVCCQRVTLYTSFAEYWQHNNLRVISQYTLFLNKRIQAQQIKCVTRERIGLLFLGQGLENRPNIIINNTGNCIAQLLTNLVLLPTLSFLLNLYGMIVTKRAAVLIHLLLSFHGITFHPVPNFLIL